MHDFEKNSGFHYSYTHYSLEILQFLDKKTLFRVDIVVVVVVVVVVVDVVVVVVVVLLKI